MRIHQLANDDTLYPFCAGYYLVVSDDLEEELAGPFEYLTEAEEWIKENIVYLE